MSQTAKLRTVFVLLLAATVVAAVVGWFMDKDPTKLTGVLGVVVTAVGVGEASNVGKRATFKPEA